MRRVIVVLVTGAIVALAAGVVVLDRQQVRRGAPSLLTLPWGQRTSAGTAPEPRRLGARPRTGGAPAGRIALVIDQLGARADVFERVLALERPVTVAVLPGLPLSRRIARDAREAGLEVLLQLPLEPYRFPELDPGPGVLTTAMSLDEIARRTRDHLGSVSGIAGVTTHMGSRFTEDRARVTALLEPLRGRDLVFLDSLTTQRSVGYDVARGLGLRAARRQVFVDPDDREATARAGLAATEEWATSRGAVIAVGRGRLLTVRLVEQALPRWEARGLRLVPLSELVDTPGGRRARRAA